MTRRFSASNARARLTLPRQAVSAKTLAAQGGLTRLGDFRFLRFLHPITHLGGAVAALSLCFFYKAKKEERQERQHVETPANSGFAAASRPLVFPRQTRQLQRQNCAATRKEVTHESVHGNAAAPFHTTRSRETHRASCRAAAPVPAPARLRGHPDKLVELDGTCRQATPVVTGSGRASCVFKPTPQAGPAACRRCAACPWVQ